MPVHEDESRESALVMIAQILVLLLVFAVPTIILLLIFPKHTATIVLVAVYALFAISALFAGIGWHEPTFSRTAKTYTKFIIAFTVISMGWSKWTANPEQEYTDWAFAVLVRAAILVLPFFFGRFISKQLISASKPK